MIATHTALHPLASAPVAPKPHFALESHPVLEGIDDRLRESCPGTRTAMDWMSRSGHSIAVLSGCELAQASTADLQLGVQLEDDATRSSPPLHPVRRSARVR